MIRSFYILLCALVLTGCFPDDRDGCPADMRFRFHLEDRYEAGDFDSRIGNDVIIYTFKDKTLVDMRTAPYHVISSDGEYTIRKTAELSGELQFVAWSQTPVRSAGVPSWSIGDRLGDKKIGLTKIDGTGYHEPVPTELFLGRDGGYEALDSEGVYRIGMNHAPCRVEVYVTDMTGQMDAGSQKNITLVGTMTGMDMDKNGTGDEAVVYVPLLNSASQAGKYDTGRFGVMPSSAGQTVGVNIYAGGELIQTLNVPRDELPDGARSGGLIIFEYVMGEAHFFVEIEGYRIKVVITDM